VVHKYAEIQDAGFAVGPCTFVELPGSEVLGSLPPVRLGHSAVGCSVGQVTQFSRRLQNSGLGLPRTSVILCPVRCVSQLRLPDLDWTLSVAKPRLKRLPGYISKRQKKRVVRY